MHSKLFANIEVLNENMIIIVFTYYRAELSKICNLA